MVKIIVNCIIQNGTKVLMVQENWGDVKGQWNFPAGQMDDDENIFEAAIREAKEETGYDVELTGLLDIQNSRYDDRNVLHVCFTAKVVGGDVHFDISEIADCKFFEIEDVINMPDNLLRGTDSRRATLRKLQNNQVLPLSTITNFDFRTNVR